MLRQSAKWNLCLTTRHLRWEIDSKSQKDDQASCDTREARSLAGRSWFPSSHRQSSNTYMKDQDELPLMRDCLHERSVRHRADVFQGRAAARPRLVSGFGRVPTCTRCLLCKLEKHGKMEVKVDVLLCLMKTFTPWPARLFRSTNCCSLSPKSKWLLTACKNSMKAALICLTLLLSCASSGTEEWRHEGETNILQCGNAWPDVTENSFKTSSIWQSGDVVTAFLMFWSDVPLMVDQHCPFSWSAIEFESKSFLWFFSSKKRPHTWKALLLPTRWFWAVSLPPVSKWRSCAELHTKMVNIIEIHTSCSDSFDDANDSMILPFYEEPLNLPSVGTW